MSLPLLDDAVVRACLTESDSYTEVLVLKPVSRAPGQALIQILSCLHHASDPRRWQLRHQVIVQRADLLRLRDTIDQWLGSAAKAP